MLYICLLGGKHPRARIEVHDVVFARGERLEETYGQLRQDWFGSPQGLHIDAWMAVDGVDGYRLTWSDRAPAAHSPRLYFLNLGGYEPGVFGEAHRYLLVVARNRAEAKAEGKRRMDARWLEGHTDALLDVDDCLPIDLVGGRYVELVPGQHQGISQRSEYIILG